MIPIFDPPDPVATTYVGLCAAIVGGVPRSIYAVLPDEHRRLKDLVTPAFAGLGGIYGLAVWIMALTGKIEESGVFMARPFDAATLVGGALGLGALAGTFVGAYYLGCGRLISLQDFADRGAAIAFLFGILALIAMPDLQSI